MTNTNVVISRQVRRYLEANDLTQSALGRRLAMSQASVHMKINNRRRWTVDDVRRLIDLDVLPVDALLKVTESESD